MGTELSKEKAVEKQEVEVRKKKKDVDEKAVTEMKEHNRSDGTTIKETDTSSKFEKQEVEVKKKKKEVDEKAVTEMKEHNRSDGTTIKETDTSSKFSISSVFQSDPEEEKCGAEENSGTKSFILSARNLSITWSEDWRYWCWFSLKDPASNENIEVANLLNVCWLEVIGKFKTTNLSPGTMYEVAFVVMLKEQAYGWKIPVTLRLVCPDGKSQERKEVLKEKPRGQWIELLVGNFSAPGEKQGEIEFSLLEYNSGQWKSGLIIKGAIIRPKI
ncbi:uncharacterized protein PHLOEM PROTEIN 2-LIKE A4-like [Tasmannia lanceolata]|uniref:uncharacterized protein PHLOEM PROTEIN 2-LIKE A4-like n=1 Tax=Tasmannia lanceolata TaxID=3420 RepID=UPI004062F3E1